jgi:hypothetical protein
MLDGYGYRLYRVGEFDYLLRRTDVDEEDTGADRRTDGRARIQKRPQIRRTLKKSGEGAATIIEGKIVSLSIETKVAIAVATGFVLMVVGAMAQR